MDVLLAIHPFYVGILGLEPRMTGPESVVLPLHHIPLYLRFLLELRVQSYYFFNEMQNYKNFFSKSYFENNNIWEPLNATKRPLLIVHLITYLSF